ALLLGPRGPTPSPRRPRDPADSPCDVLLRMPGHDVEVPRHVLAGLRAGLAALRASDGRDGGDLLPAHGDASAAHLVAGSADRARPDAGAEQRSLRGRPAPHADRR